MKEFISLFLILLIFSLTGCLRGQPDQQVIFKLDFEDDQISQGKGNMQFSTSLAQRYFNFNGSRVLGRFGTGGIDIIFDNLNAHDIVEVRYDLYIHDNWEGNGLRGNGEDVTILNIGPTTVFFSSIINTKCLDQSCTAVQSFPSIIRKQIHLENSNVTDPSLPGVCLWKGEIGGSKKIRIEKRIYHAAPNLRVNIAANIKDAGIDFCNKSWSIDNLEIKTIRVVDL
jgi:hypothetical protein